jgi:cation transport ATPase
MKTEHIEWLVVPRYATMLCVLTFSLGLSQLVWVYVDSVAILSWLSSVAASFGTMTATLVWAMREKSNQITQLHESSHSSQYEKAIKKEHELKHRSMKLSCSVLFATLLMASPMLCQQQTHSIWQWSWLVAGIGFGWCLCAGWISYYWEVQLETFKSKTKLMQKIQAEQDATLSRLSHPNASGSTGHGWEDNNETLGDPSHH